jgi:hypothetical protein
MEKRIEHGTEDWHRARSGKFTPSELYRLMTPPKFKTEKLSEGAKTYVKEKIAETLTVDISNDKMFHGNNATEWGNSFEGEAIELFSDMLNKEIINVGFINYDDNFGGTPDGISHDSLFGIEVKCPYNPSIHLDNLLLDSLAFKKERKEYYWQIQGYSLITGIENWYFISYDPRQIDYKIKIIPIKRNEEDIRFIKEKLQIATEYKQELLTKLKM